MATRIYALNPGEQNTDVREQVGPTATSAIFALVVDLDTGGVNDQGSTRAPSKEELIKALEDIKDHILRQNSWPPA